MFVDVIIIGITKFFFIRFHIARLGVFDSYHSLRHRLGKFRIGILVDHAVALAVFDDEGPTTWTASRSDLASSASVGASASSL